MATPEGFYLVKNHRLAQLSYGPYSRVGPCAGVGPCSGAIIERFHCNNIISCEQLFAVGGGRRLL